MFPAAPKSFQTIIFFTTSGFKSPSHSIMEITTWYRHFLWSNLDMRVSREGCEKPTPEKTSSKISEKLLPQTTYSIRVDIFSLMSILELSSLVRQAVCHHIVCSLCNLHSEEEYHDVMANKHCNKIEAQPFSSVTSYPCNCSTWKWFLQDLKQNQNITITNELFWLHPSEHPSNK